MSFVKNDNQQLTVLDSTFNLTEREKRMLEKSWAKTFADKAVSYTHLLIHAHAAEWGVKEDQIYVEGCSAGGHLAASLGVFWHESWISERAGVTNEILRPAGLILCYPVITSGEYAHRGSFEALLKGCLLYTSRSRLFRELPVHWVIRCR